MESRLGQVAGLGLLPVRVVFGPRKRLGRPAGLALGAPVTGYEIQHGIAEVTDPAADLSWTAAGAARCGGRAGTACWRTTSSGARSWPRWQRQAGRDFTPAPDTDFAALRQARLDVLGDLVAGHLDVAALAGLIETGPPAGLPVLVASLHHDR